MSVLIESTRPSVRALAWLALSACHAPTAPEPEGDPPAPLQVELVPRTPWLAAFPCGAQCHDAREPDPTPRALVTFHAGRALSHGPALRWCDACHAIEEPDRLRLFDDQLVSFDESSEVCAQCHGPKVRDWEHGVHGLQTGGWAGVAHRRLCTACHDPHTPGRIHLEALPPPERDPRVEVE